MFADLLMMQRISSSDGQDQGTVVPLDKLADFIKSALQGTMQPVIASAGTPGAVVKSKSTTQPAAAASVHSTDHGHEINFTVVTVTTASAESTDNSANNAAAWSKRKRRELDIVQHKLLVALDMILQTNPQTSIRLHVDTGRSKEFLKKVFVVELPFVAVRNAVTLLSSASPAFKDELDKMLAHMPSGAQRKVLKQFVSEVIGYADEVQTAAMAASAGTSSKKGAKGPAVKAVAAGNPKDGAKVVSYVYSLVDDQIDTLCVAAQLLSGLRVL